MSAAENEPIYMTPEVSTLVAMAREGEWLCARMGQGCSTSMIETSAASVDPPEYPVAATVLA